MQSPDISVLRRKLNIAETFLFGGWFVLAESFYPSPVLCDYEEFPEFKAVGFLWHLDPGCALSFPSYSDAFHFLEKFGHEEDFLLFRFLNRLILFVWSHLIYPGRGYTLFLYVRILSIKRGGNYERNFSEFRVWTTTGLFCCLCGLF
ncbi:hypothetical protein SIN95_004372 [Escherichia coli]|nr:hypothetical protein [Escherichia coli]